MSFSDPIISFSLLSIANLMYGMLYKRQFFFIKLVELNCIVCCFQLIIRLCVCSHLLIKIIVYVKEQSECIQLSRILAHIEEKKKGNENQHSKSEDIASSANQCQHKHKRLMLKSGQSSVAGMVLTQIGKPFLVLGSMLDKNPDIYISNFAKQQITCSIQFLMIILTKAFLINCQTILLFLSVSLIVFFSLKINILLIYTKNSLISIASFLLSINKWVFTSITLVLKIKYLPLTLDISFYMAQVKIFIVLLVLLFISFFKCLGLQF